MNELQPLTTTPSENNKVTLRYNGHEKQCTFIKDRFKTQNAKIWEIQISGDKNTCALKTFNDNYIDNVQRQALNYNLSVEWAKIKELVQDIPAFAWVKESYCPTNTAPEDNDYYMSIIMPWLNGSTLGAIKEKMNEGENPLHECDIHQIAQLFIDSLVELEEHDISHIDICSDNVLFDLAVPKDPKVHIIDIEELYNLELSQPPFTYIIELQRNDASGQVGYRFPGELACSGWCMHADRYSAAIMLSQILTINNQTIRENWSDEHGYFSYTCLMDADDKKRCTLLLEALQQQGYGCLHQQIDKILNSNASTAIGALPQLADLKRALCTDITNMSSQSASTAHNTSSAVVQPVHNSTILPPPQHGDIPSSNPQQSAASQHRDEVLTPYNTFATTKEPVLFVIVVDISQSMYEHQGIDNAISLCNQLLGKLRRNAQLSDMIVARYHVALFCYHSQAINVFDSLERNNPGTLTSIGVKPKPQTIAGYPAMVTIAQLEGFSLSRNIIEKIRPPKLSAKYAQTNYSEMFGAVHKFLEQHVQTYSTSHPPYVFHITDGNITDLHKEDVKEKSQRIRDLSTNYGNVLLSNILIDNSLISSADKFDQDMIELLRQISSPIPDKYVDTYSELRGLPCMFYYPCIDELEKYIVTTSMTGSRR